MNTGPLRRLIGTAGLVLLAPTAVMLLTGGITPFEAGVRALATLAGTIVVGRVAAWWLDSLAESFERELAEHEEATADAGGAPQRRRGEGKVAQSD